MCFMLFQNDQLLFWQCFYFHNKTSSYTTTSSYTATKVIGTTTYLLTFAFSKRWNELQLNMIDTDQHKRAINNKLISFKCKLSTLGTLVLKIFIKQFVSNIK